MVGPFCAKAAQSTRSQAPMPSASLAKDYSYWLEHHMSIEISVTGFRQEYRQLISDGYDRKGVSGDEFDASSKFVASSVDGISVGIVRLTPGPNGPLQK